MFDGLNYNEYGALKLNYIFVCIAYYTAYDDVSNYYLILHINYNTSLHK